MPQVELKLNKRLHKVEYSQFKFLRKQKIRKNEFPITLPCVRRYNVHAPTAPTAPPGPPSSCYPYYGSNKNSGQKCLFVKILLEQVKLILYFIESNIGNRRHLRKCFKIEQFLNKLLLKHIYQFSICHVINHLMNTSMQKAESTLISSNYNNRANFRDFIDLSNTRLALHFANKG